MNCFSDQSDNFYEQYGLFTTNTKSKSSDLLKASQNLQGFSQVVTPRFDTQNRLSLGFLLGVITSLTQFCQFGA